MKNYASQSTSRPGASHRKKNCVCGGHNSRNHKSNLNHHGTKMKLYQRQGRKKK